MLSPSQVQGLDTPLNCSLSCIRSGETLFLRSVETLFLRSVETLFLRVWNELCNSCPVSTFNLYSDIYVSFVKTYGFIYLYFHSKPSNGSVTVDINSQSHRLTKFKPIF